MRVLGLVKELQAELMTGKDLPHLVSVRLLARLDEAERHLGGKGFGSTQPPAPHPERRTAPKGENAVEADKEVDGGSSTGSD